MTVKNDDQILDLANFVYFHRKQAGLTQVELARLAGVGKSAIFDVEAGKRTLRFTTLSKILGALNIRLDWKSPLRSLYEQKK